jgi:hypothetical protein
MTRKGDHVDSRLQERLREVEALVRYYERRYGSTKIHRFRHGILLLDMYLIAMRRLKFI